MLLCIAVISEKRKFYETPKLLILLKIFLENKNYYFD